MLKPVASGPAIVACSTCRNDGGETRGGVRLAEALRTVKASDDRYDAVQIQTMPCLFACGDHCTVHLRGPGRISYVLGRFDPDEDAARAILDYAVHYARSDTGQVRYADWPEGVKGHFITRSPPDGFVAE